MAYNLNSPEFAQAWRIVSESLLAYFQGSAYATPPAQPQSGINDVQPAASTANQHDTDSSAPAAAPAAAPVAAQPRTEIGTFYAPRPIPQSDGGYLFKALVDEAQDNSIYRITKYSDGSATFVLCNLAGDKLTKFINDRDNVMPSSVGVLSGTPAAGSRITISEPGTGKTQGRCIRIVSPLRATVAGAATTE